MSLPTDLRDLPSQGTGAAAKRKTYRVLYAVTRGEWYQIEADNADDAEARAYADGHQVDRFGNPTDIADAHDVVCCELFDVAEGGGR